MQNKAVPLPPENRPPVPHIDFYCGCGTRLYILSANWQGIGIPEWDYTCEGCGAVYGFTDSIVAVKKKRASRARAIAERERLAPYRTSHNHSSHRSERQKSKPFLEAFSL